MIARHILTRTLTIAGLLLAGCGDGDTTTDSPDTTVEAKTPQAMGALCLGHSECLSGVCLESEYGPPFCTRPCDEPQTPCSEGVDAAPGVALCISYDDRPDQDLPFLGDLTTFCVPRCTTITDCKEHNEDWEVCDQPTHLGNPLYPNLGNTLVCQSPSYQGKDPVDPAKCDWEKTITHQTANGAVLCEKYCAYLDTCKEIDTDGDLTCCEWGCFNRMVLEGEIEPDWYDEVMCYIQWHASLPAVGQVNKCSEPPKKCDGYPTDTTPAAATP
jgi:hypothetical protein